MPLRPASDYDKLTPDDEAQVEEILTHVGEHFDKGGETYLVNVVATEEDRKIPDRVWKEVARRASALGYGGGFQGAVLELRKR